MFFFADNDPYHFGTVLLSVWSFFQVATFDVRYYGISLNLFVLTIYLLFNYVAMDRYFLCKLCGL